MNSSAVPVFREFGPDHWTVLFLTAAAALSLILAAKRIRRFHDDRVLRWGLAAVLAGNAVFAFFYYRHLGIEKIPFQLCDLAIFITAFALVSSNRTLAELAFFWGVAASSQPVFMPDLDRGFPDVIFIQFFFSHCGVILSALYLLVRGRVKLTPGSVWRAFLFTNLYALVAGLVNWRFGMNFGYLAGKPARPSVLDLFGPWPYYLIAEEFFALGVFFVCYGAGRLIDRYAGRQT